MIALGVLVAAAVGVAQLFALATRAVAQAQRDTTALVLAVDKLEQLRSLAWRFDAVDGRAVTDVVTDLTAETSSAGGLGLTASPAEALWTSTPGFVDYLDGSGRWRGTGVVAAPGTVYVRRWAVTPHDADGGHTLVLQVAVTTLVDDSRRRAPISRDVMPVALLSTLRTRR